MAFKKIAESEYSTKGVKVLQDVPNMSTEDLKAAFDELSEDVIIPDFNELSDQLDGDVGSLLHVYSPFIVYRPEDNPSDLDTVLSGIKSNIIAKNNLKVDNSRVVSSIPDTFTPDTITNIPTVSAVKSKLDLKVDKSNVVTSIAGATSTAIPTVDATKGYALAKTNVKTFEEGSVYSIYDVPSAIATENEISRIDSDIANKYDKSHVIVYVPTDFDGIPTDAVSTSRAVRMALDYKFDKLNVTNTITEGTFANKVPNDYAVQKYVNSKTAELPSTLKSASGTSLETNTAKGGIRINGIVGNSVKNDDGLFSAGEYGLVDLGTLTWTYGQWNGGGEFYTTFTNAKSCDNAKITNCVCEKYASVSRDTLYSNPTMKAIAINNASVIIIRDSSYTSASAFTSAMNGVKLAYEVADGATPSQYALVMKEHNADSTQSKSVFIPLSQPLAKLDSLVNEIVKVGDKWYEKKVVGCVDLGTLDIQYNSTLRVFYLYLSGKKTGSRTNYICDGFTVVNKNYQDMTDKETAGTLQDTGMNFIDLSCTSVAEFKTANGGKMLIYELATPTYTEITDQTTLYQLESYAEKTYIDTVDVYAKANITLEYGSENLAATVLNGERIAMLNQARLDAVLGASGDTISVQTDDVAVQSDGE